MMLFLKRFDSRALLSWFDLLSPSLLLAVVGGGNSTEALNKKAAAN
jgi:hypothetical protein